MPTLIILVTRVHFAVGILVPHLGVFGGKQRRVAEPLRNCVCCSVSPELEWASWDMDTRTSGCCPRAGCGLFPAQRPARRWSGCRLTGTSHLVHRAGSWAVSDTSAGFLGPARTLLHRRRLSLGRGLVRVPDGGEGGPRPAPVLPRGWWNPASRATYGAIREVCTGPEMRPKLRSLAEEIFFSVSSNSPQPVAEIIIFP